MSPPAALVAYLWHYMLARLLYDELVRPMLHGRLPVTLIVAVGAGVLFRFGRLRLGRRHGRPRHGRRSRRRA